MEQRISDESIDLAIKEREASANEWGMPPDHVVGYAELMDLRDCRKELEWSGAMVKALSEAQDANVAQIKTLQTELAASQAREAASRAEVAESIKTAFCRGYAAGYRDCEDGAKEDSEDAWGDSFADLLPDAPSKDKGAVK